MTIELAAYSEFLGTIPDAALIVDAAGRIVFANALAEQMLRYAPGSMRTLPLSCLIPASQRARHADQVGDFFHRPCLRPMGTGHHFTAQRADGSVFPVDIMLQPLRVGGEPQVLSIVRDITERRRMEAELHTAIERERTLAHTDALTGAANRRFFVDMVQREIDRALRYVHVFCLAYVDLDNFKAVNDRWGHSSGDDLLRSVVEAMSSHLRATDLLARLGGDEFALLLPETGAEGAVTTLRKMRDSVSEAMTPRGWPVTLSVGVLTCRQMPATVDDLVRAADALMYRAKSNGKDAIECGEFTPPEA